MDTYALVSYRSRHYGSRPDSNGLGAYLPRLSAGFMTKQDLSLLACPAGLTTELDGLPQHQFVVWSWTALPPQLNKEFSKTLQVAR